MGGGERGLRRLHECVRGRVDAETDSSEDVRRSMCAVHAVPFKCKRERKKKRKETESTHTQQLGCYKSHSGDTWGRKSDQAAACAAGQLVVVFSPHPSHTPFLLPLCMFRRSHTHTDRRSHAHTDL